ncbi:MAG: glucose 1-dehydrogenase [Chloroflexi bacterium]|nr:glucose 1-dehydrogenase [Chloroflexota bacterium]MCY3938583.1 glucose 1-dehydrogenase [Chloroflexota bacterium]
MARLDGKVAVITGSGRGIGRGCALVFAREGCKVVVATRTEGPGMKTVKDIEDEGGHAAFVQTDVSAPAQIAKAIKIGVERYGRLDVLVNNAGWHPPSMTIDETSLNDLESLLRLNLTSTFMGCKYAVKHLRKTRGCIINMASMVGILGQNNAVSYCATKAGQIGLTKALAMELAPVGVRVNAVLPAGVDTPLMHEWASSMPDTEASLQLVDAIHPIGRMATAEEIGRACLFLASEDAAFVTGHSLQVDGGASLDY